MSDSVEDKALAACLAEYEALRSEIAWLIEHALHIQNYAIGISAGIYPVAALTYGAAQPLLVALLLTAPLPLAVLGFLYFRQHQEVFVVAAYIRDELRPRVRDITGRQDLWTWEEFKEEKFQRLAAQSGPLGFQSPRVILISRLALFIVPAASSVVVAVGVAVVEGRQTLGDFFGPLGVVGLGVALILDMFLLFILARRFWREGDFRRTTLGAAEGGRAPPGESDGDPGGD